MDLPCGSIANGIVLCLRDLDQHLSCGVFDGYGFQDRRPVVSDGNPHVVWVGDLFICGGKIIKYYQ
jgi:hypothetical protein